MSAAALGLDLGTTNVKAVVVDDSGQIIGRGQRELTTIRQGEVAEQDPEELWRRTSAAAAEAIADAATTDIGQIGVCSQYSSIVGVDVNGKPTTPLVMWMDRRGTEPSWDIIHRDDTAFGTWVERHGIPPVGGGLALGHILHLQRHEPGLHAATHAYVEPMDYLVARLTGRAVATQHSMFMAQLCDNRAVGATDYDAELLSRAEIDASRLPDLVVATEPVGELQSSAAAALGIPAGAVVHPGTNDTATGCLATGATMPDRSGLAIGTTSVLLDGVDRMAVDLDHEILSMPGPFGDDYVLWAENGLGGRVLQHVLESFVYVDDELGEHGASEPYAKLESALAASPPGANGVLALPWFGGSLAPDSDTEMRGGFLNLSLDSSRHDLVRASAESVGHNLAWLLPHVEAFTGRPVTELTFLGGAARSAGWTQILADILARPVRTLEEPERAVARATAQLARHRAGLLDRAAVSDGGPTARVFEPDSQLRDLYDGRQAQFEAAFAAMQPISHALNDPSS